MSERSFRICRQEQNGNGKTSGYVTYILRCFCLINPEGILYHFDQFGHSLGFLIFRETPENLKIFETFESGVRKNQVGQGTAELNEMVQ